MKHPAFYSRGRCLLQSVFWSVLIALCATGCDQWSSKDLVIEQGEYRGLRIGQSRNEVLQRLRENGVASIHPDLVMETAVKVGSLQRISGLENADAFCVNDGKGYSARISFDAGDSVGEVYLSPKAGSDSLGIRESQTRKEALTALKDALIANHTLTARECLPSRRKDPWIPLSALTAEDIDYLGGFDAWSFTEKEGFSYATVIFWNDRLLQIQYHRRPFEET